MKTAQTDIELRDAAIASMKQVLALPSGSPKRWRAGYLHFIRQRPEAQVEAYWTAEAVKERKLLVDKFASTKNGRHTMMSPTYLQSVLRVTDPEYFLNKTPIDLVRPVHLRKMKEAFPEFFLPEII